MKTAQELLAEMLEVMHAWASQEGGFPKNLAALCYEVKAWLNTATHVETAVRTLLADDGDQAWTAHERDNDVILVLRNISDESLRRVMRVLSGLTVQVPRAEPAPTTEEAT